MELILLENILNLGNIGDKVKVKNGYGRNYLLKKGKALRFNKENQDFVSKKKDELNKKNIEVKNKFKEISDVVNKKTFSISKESKENGELYGSIKPKEITNLIKEKLNVEVSPSQIILKNNLDKIGVYRVDINFHSEVKAQISIKINKIHKNEQIPDGSTPFCNGWLNSTPKVNCVKLDGSTPSCNGWLNSSPKDN